MIRRFLRKPLRQPTFMTLVAIALVTPIPVRSEAPPDPDSSAHNAPQTSDDTARDRVYKSKRDRSLSERERFSPRRFPPDPSVVGALQESAAQDGYDRGYEDGFEEGYRAAKKATGNQARTTLYAAAIAQGIEHFQNRRYGAAVRDFILAAKNDQGDPLSRLHAAHTMVALGHFEDAFLLIRRAIQLQPNLVYLPIDIRKTYTDQSEFTKHLDQLTLEANSVKDDPMLWTLLGHYRFFSDRHPGALRALRRAAELAPRDKYIADLLDVVRLSTPAPSNSPH